MKYFLCFRRKTRLELIKLSLSVCGIELAYASETGEKFSIENVDDVYDFFLGSHFLAFVSPTLLVSCSEFFIECESL